MKLENQFTDIVSYTDNLRKGMTDKLFFLDYLPREDLLFLDFGCADGSMIKALREDPRCQGRNHGFVGYDISKEMIGLAKKKQGKLQSDHTFFTTSWKSAMDFIRKERQSHPRKTVLILSSVIHEVYSYEASVDTFWSRVTDAGFDYVTVRDMMPSKTIDRATEATIYKTFMKHQQKVLQPNQIADFEQHWGKLSNNKNLVHFLLKYRWVINWSREVKENYFPIYAEDFVEKLKSYRTLYYEAFRVKFLDECILKDFGIQLVDNTHIKAVFAKHQV